MPETLLYSRLEVKAGEELYTEIKELSSSEGQNKSPSCEICVRKRPLLETEAIFLCFVCKVYVCFSCMPKHEYHDGMQVTKTKKESKVEREGSEKMDETSERGKNREQGESERVKDKAMGLGKKSKRMRLEADIKRQKEREDTDRVTERDKTRRKYIFNTMNESENEREEKFYNNQVSIYDRLDVRHELNKAEVCWITGLCGLGNNRLVVCDDNNSCLKIFKLGGKMLERYVWFSRFPPRGVTEICLKQNISEQKLVSSNSSSITETARADSDKHCLVAVTVPKKRQIILIAFSTKPAEIWNVIHTEGQCYSITFYDENIFIGCKEPVTLPVLFM